MRKKSTLTGMLLLMSVTGCSNMNNTEKGLLAGTAVGAVLGTAVGIATRNPAAGAAIGGVTGAAVGGVAGADQDRRDYQDKVVQAQNVAIANAARNQMTLNDVVQLSQVNTPPEIIMQQIDSTNSVFSLSSDDLIYLQQQGVSNRVIQFMQTRRARVVVVQPPPPGVVVVGPPPVIGVGIGGGYGYGYGYRRY